MKIINYAIEINTHGSISADCDGIRSQSGKINFEKLDLADGYIRNNQVYCPMHNWAFDIKTGAFAFNPGQKIKTYPVEIRNNEIFILYDSHIR